MWKIVPYVIVQSILLVGGQVFLKLALTRMPAFCCLWCAVLPGLVAVDVYHETVSFQYGLSHGQPELCLRHAGSHRCLP